MSVKKIATAVALVVALAIAAYVGRARWQRQSQAGPDGGSSQATADPAEISLVRKPTALAPALALALELAGEPQYEGDPLLLTVRVQSPRFQQEAYLALLARESGQAASAPTPAWKQVPPAWPHQLAFAVFRVGGNGERQPLRGAFEWNDFLLDSNLGPVPSPLGVPRGEWLIPPESLDLAAGKYVLQVRWNGTGIGTDGMVAGELGFEVKSAQSDSEQAAHDRRLAAMYYKQRKFDRARTLGEEALGKDPAAFTPDVVETYLLVADSCLAARDVAAALETLRKLQPRLLPGSHLEEMVRERAAMLETRR